jgi:hypothetical protein
MFLLREGESMKSKTFIGFVATAVMLGWQVGAQTDQAPSPYWVVNGQIYDINKSSLWVKMDGDIVKILTNGIVVETFTVETKQQAVVEQHATQGAFGFTGRYHSETKMVDVGTEKVPGRKIIIRNYPVEENPAVGKTISFLAMQTGTSDYKGDRLELWDLGTVPTADDLRKLKADTEERQRAAQKELDEQRRAVAEKASATKKTAEAKVLKSNQEAADKGDMYGLLRMGGRYRDGDGVEKDLAKAKDYLTRAAAAGSPTAAAELSKLNQVSTNSAATQ